jgi:hypothetical protein
VDGGAIHALFQKYIAGRVELSFVLATQTLIDVLIEDQPVALMLERHGRLEKLQVVLLTKRSYWDEVFPTVPRESRLSKKPASVAREPERRPAADPRPFVPLAGKKIELRLRNGIQLANRVLAVGPFDLVVGENEREMLVPLHAISAWQTEQGV